jgi:hypothetical protein
MSAPTWKAFYGSNRLTSTSNPSADQVDLAARGALGFGFAFANDFGPLKEQSTNFLMDAAEGIANYSMSLIGQPALVGIDPQTKKFTEAPEQIKEQIAALEIDKSVSEAEKKEDLEELEAALKEQSSFSSRNTSRLVPKYFISPRRS